MENKKTINKKQVNYFKNFQISEINLKKDDDEAQKMLRVYEDSFKDEKSKLSAPKAFVKGGVIDPTLVKKPINNKIFYPFFVIFRRKKLTKKKKEIFTYPLKL